MVLVQRGPQDTGKEYPRTVEDASLPSSSSSWPPLRRVSFLFSSACLPSVLLSFLLVNMPLPSPIRISTRKGNRRLLQMLHTKRDIISLFRSLSLSLSLPSFLSFLLFLFFCPDLYSIFFFSSSPPAFSIIIFRLSLSPPPIHALRAARLSYELRNQGASSRALEMESTTTMREHAKIRGQG